MALKIDPKVVSVIVDAVRKSADGATLNDIIAAFAEPPDRRVAHRWLASLIRVKVLDVDTSSRAHRYRLLSNPDEHLDTSLETTGASPDSHAGQVSTSAAATPELSHVDTSPAASPNDVDTSPEGGVPALGSVPKPRAQAGADDLSTSMQEAPVPAHVDTSSAHRYRLWSSPDEHLDT